MRLNIDNTRPVYLQIEEYIRNAVITNVYPSGSRVPTVREFAAEIGVNPNTIQRAMTELEHQGLLISQGTSGKTVTEDRAVIDAIRQSAVEKAIRDFYNRFTALGLSMADAAELLLNLEKEE